MTNVLDIRNLSIDFRTPLGSVHAIRNISLTVEKGRTVGIVGESGCGKSTVASSAIRLLPGNAEITNGQVLLCGQDVLSQTAEALRDIRGRYASMIFQDPMTAQNPVISIANQMIDIQFRDADITRQQKKDRAINMLKRVGIPDPEQKIERFSHEFSGGMRQRLSIAMALLVNPQLLIADEPTTALDVNTEAQIAKLLRQLQQESGAGMLVVSHNLGLIAELCDDVIVMYAGEIVERGTVRELFHSPQHPYTQRLLDCDPARVSERAKNLPTIPGHVPDLRHAHTGCIFAPRCHKAKPVCEIEAPITISSSATHRIRCHFAISGTTILSNSVPSDPPPALLTNIEAPSNDVLLDVDSLRVRFRTDSFLTALFRRKKDPYVDAVLNVSLQLRRGETFGLVGESGSGKTTLGKAIIGLAQPQSGSITFDGSELVGLSNAQYNTHRHKVSMMFQDPIASLSPRRTARSLVMEPFEIHGVDVLDKAETAHKLFSMVGLSPAFYDRFPSELSGGQARRVGVARALALSPKLIIADEPTAGLDVSVQGEILNLMRELQRENGLSYLIVSHNLPAIQHISDRLGVMYLGQIIEQGPASEIFAEPAHPYTRALLDGVPRPDPDGRRQSLPIEGEVPSLADRPPGCNFHPRCPFAKERCRTDVPEYRNIGNERQVSCHFPLL